MTDNDFVHLHVHTEFSLLDGLSRIEDLVGRAKALEMPALAITDHGTMFGVIDFFRACRSAGIKPIIGVEAYLARRSMENRDPKLDKKPFHLLLLAQNMHGYRNLLKIASESQLRGYYYRPRIDKQFLREHANGLIATTGCLAAEIPALVTEGREADAERMIGEYQEIFGKENFFLELQHHQIGELDVLNKWLANYRKKNHTPIQLVATNDVHYVNFNDYDPHDTLLCIQTSALKTDENRLRMTDPSYHLTSHEEMWRNFSWLPEDLRKEALFNTRKIAEMCEVDLTTSGYHLPVFPVPRGYNSASYVRHLCEKGLQWRFGDRVSDPVLTDRLNRELDIIHSMGFDTYFLIVWDLCEYARSADMWWNVRGSGAGSLALYCLGITNIDPIENNLLFERFLNPGRVSMPDIDIDYPDDRRGEMIAYTVRKYGDEKVAAIITFGTMGPKAAVRDVGRALDVPLELVNRAARLIPQEPKPKPLMDYVNANPELREMYDKVTEIKTIVDTASKLQGVNRHASTHAAGVIIADRPLVDYLPLHRITGTDNSGGVLKAVTQFPMETCESIGLLKIDFLGLSTLTILRKACDLIEQHHGIKYTMDNIPYRHDHIDEEGISKELDEAFELMGRGQTVGVFQVESSGMRQMLRDMRPTRFEHIIAAVSLYRPGPMDFIPMYNKRMHGDEPIEYRHPRLASILEETYGILVYQEQLMQVAGELFGYELGEADLMRRAVSKKKEKDLMKHKSIFIERGPQNGIDEQAAEAIFADIEFFANYGFNKCVTYNTEIIDATTGRLVKVGDVVTGKVNVRETLTTDINRLQLQPGDITDAMENGVKPVYRLTTQLGRQIEATANHPFLTHSGWQMLGELNTGDQIAVPRHIPVEGKREWADHEIMSLADDIAHHAVGEIPSEVFELTNEQIHLLIAAIWEQCGDSVVSTAYIDLGSERVALQIQHLLLRLDILSTVQNDVIAISHNEGFEHFISVVNLHQVSAIAMPIRTHFCLPIQQTQNHDVYWDSIASIEYIGEEMTYDLTIKGTHNFVANDIIVHNSHAADYAVLTVQSAYLKCHYQEEYLTALLSVHSDDSVKITTFLTESRELGTPILPPDINYSGLNFDIETMQNGKRGIRFGLAGIKGTGEGSVQHIITARIEGGPFTNLEDLCRRVDLRAVGKRTLENLVKVGALDNFADQKLEESDRRQQVLNAVERMVGYSDDLHEAERVGQMSMFGGGAVEMSVQLLQPVTDHPFSRREMLNWEKELLGVYVTGRPADRIAGELERANNTVEIQELKDSEGGWHDKMITVAGEIIAIRKFPTKDNKMMGVAQLEDWHVTAGTIEVVLFPRMWDKFQTLVDKGRVVIITGKYDASRADPQVICENVSQEVHFSEAVGEMTHHNGNGQPSWMPDEPSPINGVEFDPPPLDYDEETGELPQPEPILEPAFAEVIAPATQGAAAVPMPAVQSRFLPATAFVWNGTDPEAQPNFWFILYLPRSDNDEQDRRRFRHLHNILRSYPGNDRFTIVIESKEKLIKMEFPNYRTGYCQNLMDDLYALIGTDNVEVHERPH